MIKELLNKNFWDRLLPTIRTKVIAVFFLFIFVPLIILAFVTYNRVAADYQADTEYAANQAFEQAAGYIEYKVSTLISTSDYIHFNQDVQTIFKRDRELIEADQLQQYKDNLVLERMIYALKNDQDVFRVTLYVADWLTYSNQSYYFRSISEFENTLSYSRLKDYRGKVIWMPPYEVPDDNNKFRRVEIIPVVRKIKDTDNLNTVLGYMELSLRQSTIEDIVDKADTTLQGGVYLINVHQELLAGKPTADEAMLESVMGFMSHRVGGSSKGEWLTEEKDKEKLRIRFQEINQTDWYLVSAIPESEILSSATEIKNFIIFLYITGGLIAFGMALVLSKSLTDRIHKLSEQMVQVQNGEMNVEATDESQDEIGQLNRSFNYMLHQLRGLLKKYYDAGQELKSAELKALQAQINPHFLYNTLDMINWKAIERKAPEITDISQALAKFYKLSLSKGKDIISLKDELSHVEQYVKIQNMRYENKIDYRVDVDDEILNCVLPKIILQPLIENAILHGIFKREGVNGVITVSGWQEDMDMVLEVTDNGMGMNEDEINSILSFSTTEESHGYGVRNIHERIRLMYGEEYGLTYMSESGKGTTVIIRLPARS